MRRLVQRVESAFDKAGRILVPSRVVFSEAGDALRRLQAARGFRIETHHSIVNDVLIALSARSIGATVVTQNERDYRAIQSVRPFQSARSGMHSSVSIACVLLARIAAIDDCRLS